MIVPAVKPRYPELASYDTWLAQMAMGDPGRACEALVGLLNELDDAPPPRAAYLHMLERVRRPLFAALGDLTRRFAGKPLPLSHAEAAAFSQVSDVWLALLRCYRRLLQTTGQSTAADSGADLRVPASRAVHCIAELVAANLLARREVPGELWQSLHAAYAFAEEHRVASGDGVRDDGTASYVQVLLLALARLHALSQRDALLAYAWAKRFAHKVHVEPCTSHAAAYAVDLGSNAPAAWRTAQALADTGHSALRFLNTDALVHSLRRRLRHLKSGDDPAQLGLVVQDGPAVSASTALELLHALICNWCEAPAVGRFQRRVVPAAAAQVEAAIGLVAAHEAISGKPFNDEAHSWEYTRRHPIPIRPLQRLPVANAATKAKAVECWLAVDESALGFRLQRRDPGARIAHRQLLALRLGNAPRFILADVRWLLQGPGQSLMLGVHALPGMAHPCAARPTSADPAKPGAYSRAFLTPMTPGMAPSLVLPAGWFQQGRELDLRLDQSVVRIRLESLLGKGSDYDQAHFAAVA